jgi:hypothetical protein
MSAAKLSVLVLQDMHKKLQMRCNVIYDMLLTCFTSC